MITIALLYDFMTFISHYLQSVCGPFVEKARLQIIFNNSMIQDHRSTQDGIAQIMCAIVLSANSYREMHDTMALRPENEDEEGRETKYSRRYQAHLNFPNFSSLRIRLNRGDLRTISVRHKACPTRSQGD
jgi:hypothetical protein